MVFGNYWINTQPIGIVASKISAPIAQTIPAKNKSIIDYIEKHGQSLAPNYESVVCTEFVIKVLNQFTTLTRNEARGIRIITSEDLVELINTGDPIIKGVQTALIENGKGIAVDNPKSVKPGDFVQFWNLNGGSAYGHCGIVHAINPKHTLTVYSSHPLTNGYGKQEFLWPQKVFFVRLR